MNGKAPFGLNTSPFPLSLLKGERVIFLPERKANASIECLAGPCQGLIQRCDLSYNKRQFTKEELWYELQFSMTIKRLRCK